MKLNYDHPEMETLFAKIISAEKLNKGKILSAYQRFAGQLNFDNFISPDSLNLIREIAQVQDSSYSIGDRMHWLNQINGFDADTIANFVKEYIQNKNIAGSILSDDDYDIIHQGLHQIIVSQSASLFTILERLNFLRP